MAYPRQDPWRSHRCTRLGVHERTRSFSRFWGPLWLTPASTLSIIHAYLFKQRVLPEAEEEEEAAIAGPKGGEEMLKGERPEGHHSGEEDPGGPSDVPLSHFLPRVQPREPSPVLS